MPRMILAGIDEAGYGPILGPMVVGVAAVELPAPAIDPDDPDAPLPDAWATLRRAVSRTRDPAGRRLHVEDSKRVYSAAAGLGELERAVCCLDAARRGGPPVGSLDDLLGHAAADSVADLAGLPWYRPADAEPFPIAVDAVNLRLAANACRHELAAARVAVVRLHAHALTEARLNTLFAATRNKAATSFASVASHVDGLLRDFADRGLVVVCDRQGGREHYGSLLRQMWPDWSLTVLRERPERADYLLTDGPRQARLIFAEGSERLCLPTAVASMLAKYLREALMARFNRYWLGHDPTLTPTAGYWTDGQRFLADLAPTLARLGVDPATLTRSR